MSNYHALIIDDQPPNIDVLAMLLTQENISYTSATSARQVAGVIDASPQIDVVFLDLEMPNGNYYDLLSSLKADPRLSGVPIVAYTVHTSEIDQARNAGFDSFLGKPLSTTEFPDQIRRILNGESVWTY
ncbi:MAG: response regulator [Anaerolineae bacterium]|nr:response regulator [Anaerolineae bacterium]